MVSNKPINQITNDEHDIANQAKRVFLVGGADIQIGVVEIESARDLQGLGKISVGTTALEVSFSGVTTSIVITADIENTGKLFVGKSDVTSTGANAITFLEAGDSIKLDYDDVDNALYVVADTVSQNYWAGALKND